MYVDEAKGESGEREFSLHKVTADELLIIYNALGYFVEKTEKKVKDLHGPSINEMSREAHLQFHHIIKDIKEKSCKALELRKSIYQKQ